MNSAPAELLQLLTNCSTSAISGGKPLPADAPFAKTKKPPCLIGIRQRGSAFGRSLSAYLFESASHGCSFYLPLRAKKIFAITN
jgi:hypothetical protein